MRNRQNGVWAVVLVAGLAMAPIVWAQRVIAPPHLQPLMDQLMAIDTVPTAEALRALDPLVEDRLVDAARDPSLNEYARARAVTLLGMFPTPETHARLLSLLSEPDDEIVAMAIYVAARTFGPDAPELVLDTTVDALQSNSRAIRKKAILAMRWIGRPEKVRTALQQHRSREPEAELVRLVDRTLRKIESQPEGQSR